MIKPVLLWSDALILLLLAGIVAGFWLARTTRLSAHRCARSWPARWAPRPLILAVYAGIGLLDSLHYVERLPSLLPGKSAQYSGEVRSALDALLTPLRDKRREDLFGAVRHASLCQGDDAGIRMAAKPATTRA
jgi:peptide/nickel transport system permease protein